MTTEYYHKTLKILLDDYACGLVTATGLIVEYIRIKFAPGEELKKSKVKNQKSKVSFSWGFRPSTRTQATQIKDFSGGLKPNA